SAINPEGNATRLAQLPNDFQLRDICINWKQLLGCVSKLFDVDSNCDRLQNLSHGGQHLLRSSSEASYNIRGEWNRQDVTYLSNGRHVLVSADNLTVRVAEGDHQPSTRRRYRRKSFVLKHPCARHIPGVRKNQNLLPMMEREKIL